MQRAMCGSQTMRTREEKKGRWASCVGLISSLFVQACLGLDLGFNLVEFMG